jgi:hypothetical protein
VATLARLLPLASISVQDDPSPPAALPRNDRSVSTAGSNRSNVEKRCDTQAMVPKNGWLVLIPAKKLAPRLDRFGSISA